MIGGFISSEGGSKVVVRSLGPTLSQFGIPDGLSDATLTLYDGNGTQIAANDDWKQTQQAQIAATGFAPPNDTESAVLITRPAGNTTATVRGKNGATGVALVEVYAVP